MILNHTKTRFPVFKIAIVILCSITILLRPDVSSADETSAEKITFDDHIGPLLRKRCSTCHNADKKSSDLDVTSLASLMQGGASGSGIEAGDSGSTYLFSLVSYEDGPEMPPAGKIPDKEIELIRKWIDGGALENSGSKAVIKPKFDMAMSESPTARPEVLPIPARMPLEPALRTSRASAPTALATSPWAPVVAIGAPKQVLLYNTSTLQLIGVLPLAEGQANSLRFSRNGALLIGGGGINGAKGLVTLWNVRTGEEIGQFGDELDAVLAADLSPDHSLLALGGPQKLVKVYSTSDGSLQYELKKHTDWVTAIEFSPDGKYLATGDRNGGLQLWYTEDGTEHLTLKAHTKMISGISWRIDGKAVASASEDTTIRIWEAENGKQIKNWASHAPGVTSIEFARDGTLVTSGRDKLVRTWTQDGAQIQQFGGLTDIAVLATYCDETQRVIAGDWTGAVQAWNATDTKLAGNLDPNPPTLAERLNSAQAQVHQTQQTHAPLAAKVAELEKTLTELTGSLQQAKQQQQTKQAALVQVQNQLVTAQKQLVSTVAEQDRWRKELTVKTEAKPLLAESHSKANEAAQKLSGDVEILKTVEQLGAKLQQLQSRVVELNGLVAKSDQMKITTQKQVEQLTQSTATAKSEMDVINQQIAQFETQIGAMNDQLLAARATADAAKLHVDQALANANRWENEIGFIAQLEQLAAELKSARDAYTVQEAAVAKANEKLKEIEAQATYARAVQSEAQQKVEDLFKKMQELRKIQK